MNNYIIEVNTWENVDGIKPLSLVNQQNSLIPLSMHSNNKEKVAEVQEVTGTRCRSKKNPNKLSDQEIFDIIREEYLAIQPNGCHDFFKKKVNSPSLPYLRKRFRMTYNDILIKAGIPKEDLNFVRCRNLDKDQLLNELKQLANVLGHTPTVKEYKKFGFSYHNLTLTFGTYNQALKEVGLKSNFDPKLRKSISKKALLKIYHDISQKVNKPASLEDIGKYCMEYSITDFVTTFGGLSELRKEAGFPGRKYNKKKYSKEGLIESLIIEYRKYKRHLTATEINANENLPVHYTIMKYFKVRSLSDLWAEIDSILVQQQIKLIEQNGKQIEQKSKFKKAEKAINHGEEHVKHQLCFLDSNYFKVYNDINLRVGALQQQFDHLVIGMNGIFHLETKNHRGTISIDRHGNWEQMKAGSIETIADPKGQICRHERVLSGIIKDNYETVTLLVFAHPRCTLKHMDRTTLNVMKAEQVVSFIKSYQGNPRKNTINVAEVCRLIEKHIVQNQNIGTSPTLKSV
ncbi:NERD domain-containing protein [Schinkia azotoformans]|uniref:NERD domain-containing protein n=1 Tax=Schinkia azotoformans TaxID=1454 RepID=UPI002DB80992|nr:NERD domain-containing protein [Schinkia azotoformans]MEC1759847.1 NERD domain-containing protein [Schinkia azotoformans]